MKGYDFDDTILNGNTVRRFWWYCCARFWYLWLLLPEMILAGLLFVLHIISKEKFLCMMELFLLFVPNKRKHAKLFWNKNQKHLRQWYLESKQPDDIIVSASPDFLLDEIASRLQVTCICTQTTKRGLTKTVHCYGPQKVVQYRNHFGDTPLQAYFSDSMSDVPMFQLAQQGYFVRKDKITLLFEDGKQIAKV